MREVLHDCLIWAWECEFKTTSPENIGRVVLWKWANTQWQADNVHVVQPMYAADLDEDGLYKVFLCTEYRYPRHTGGTAVLSGYGDGVMTLKRLSSTPVAPGSSTRDAIIAVYSTGISSLATTDAP